MQVSRAIHGLFHWGGQPIVVDSVVVKKDSIAEIKREREIGHETRKSWNKKIINEGRPAGASTTNDRNTREGK